MIEACPAVPGETGAATPAPTTAQTIWCRHGKIDEVEECSNGKEPKGEGIMVTREVVCTVEETVLSGKNDEKGEAHDQDMSSSSGPEWVILTTTSTYDDGI